MDDGESPEGRPASDGAEGRACEEHRDLEEMTNLGGSVGAEKTQPRPSSVPPAEAVAEKLPGRWGPLELIEKVGEGAFGETFRARDSRLDRDVALKLLKPEASSQQAVAGRVIREGALLARLSHPNVVAVYGAERREGRVGLWMEFVHGRTLSDLLDEQGPFGEQEAAQIGLALCRALAAVHRAGIVHRDIKAGNVMREEGGRIVLMDFGAGLDMQRERERARWVTGTPLYMAPEVVRGEGATKRSDLYSLGVLLYHLVTANFPLTARTMRELCKGHERGEVRHVRDARPDLSGEFVGIVERCLALDPSERFETAGALERALVKTLTAPERGRAREGAVRGGSASARTARAAKTDFTAWRRERIAEWSRPRYRLDKEFVALTLLVDQGEEAAAGRWSARPERYRDLRELLAAVDDPAVVLLGPPGSGKSTLLRRFEMDAAEAALAAKDLRDTVTFFVQLNNYRPQAPGGPLPEPETWLAERWRARFPALLPLPALLAEGRVVLLLDALNEMPAATAVGLREAVLQWKGFLDRLTTEHPGNRVIFSCRTLDYSAPLSTSRLRVPQVVIEPMTDDQVEQFLVKHRSEEGGEIWSQLRGTPQLEVMRSPYFLMLLVEQAEAAGGVPEGRTGLFTGFVRQALRREVERDNPLFAPDGLLTERDVRRIAQWRWKTPWELPERGALIPKIADLAFGMQDRAADGGASQVRVGFDEALDLLGQGLGEDIVRAGVALSVLDEDAAGDEVLFFHQLIQEYFAGRRLAAAPEPQRVRTGWRVEEAYPLLVEVLASLPPSETLPALPTTGWEETALLAGPMSSDPDAFVRGLMPVNLALAGRCAGQPEVRERLSKGLLDDLRRALVERSRDRAADLRARIAADLALGPLGDPRFERRKGPYGDYLMPPLAEIPSGRYPIGEDEPFEYLGQMIRSHMPRHEVEIAAFRIGRFPVTNAEWAPFLEAGGYEEERWWDTPASRQWQSGEGTAEGMHANVRYWLARFKKDPGQVERVWERGQWTEAMYERWKKRLAMTEGEFEAHLRELYPGGKIREPALWRDEAFNNPAQPVVGVCWFEARAYCLWLSGQTGGVFRLATEVEWEAAARGREGRLFAYGDAFDPLRGNTAETRIKRTTPVGVLPDGDTPEVVSDLTGNVEEWTGSLFGPGLEFDTAPVAYPYKAEDGREDPSAGAEIRRVLRGGGWGNDQIVARSAFRNGNHPASGYFDGGVRVVVGLSPISG